MGADDLAVKVLLCVKKARLYQIFAIEKCVEKRNQKEGL